MSSTRRNPVISDVFGRMNLIERRGSGLRKIIEAYQFEENYTEKLKPEFKSTESSFFVILPNLNYKMNNDGQFDRKKGQNDNNVGQKIKHDTQTDQNDTQNDTQTDQNDTPKLVPEERRKKIVKIIKNNPTTTSLELSEDLEVSESTIKRDLRLLNKKNKIEYIGSSRSGYWKVK